MAQAADAALAGQTVKVTSAGALQTSAEGMVQFLVESNATLDIEINGASVWSGNSAELVRDEVFKADGPSFARVKTG